MANLTLKCMAVANYIIDEINKYNEDKPFREKILLSVRRLQKLLYFCETEYMIKNNGKPLFEDEFCAWPSGPVIEKIYYTYLQEQNGYMNPYHIPDEPNLTNDVKCMIDRILEVTKDLYTSELIRISKVDDGPHSKVFVKEDNNYDQIVSKEDTYIYYSKYKSIPQLMIGGSILSHIAYEQENQEIDNAINTLNSMKKEQSIPRLVKRRISLKNNDNK